MTNTNNERIAAWRHRYEAAGLMSNRFAHCAQLARGVDWNARERCKPWNLARAFARIERGLLSLGPDGFLPRPQLQDSVRDFLNKHG